jgi:hypothetical protein
MVSPAEKHFLEEILGVYEPLFDDVFPDCFDWEALCADAPKMMAQLVDRDPADVPREQEAEVSSRARHIFRHAWLSTLAALVMSDEDEIDPHGAMEALFEPLSGEAEARFTELTDDLLEPLEAHLAGETPLLDPRGEEALEDAESAWPMVTEVLHEDGLFGTDEDQLPARDEEEAHGLLTVYRGLARVAVLLAAFRLMCED